MLLVMVIAQANKEAFQLFWVFGLELHLLGVEF